MILIEHAVGQAGNRVLAGHADHRRAIVVHLRLQNSVHFPAIVANIPPRLQVFRLFIPLWQGKCQLPYAVEHVLFAHVVGVLHNGHALALPVEHFYQSHHKYLSVYSTVTWSVPLVPPSTRRRVSNRVISGQSPVY